MPDSNLLSISVPYCTAYCWHSGNSIGRPSSYVCMVLPPIQPEWRGWARFCVAHLLYQAIHFLFSGVTLSTTASVYVRLRPAPDIIGQTTPYSVGIETRFYSPYG